MMEMNAVFEQAFRELEEEQNLSNAPDSPEKGNPVFSFHKPANRGGFGMAVPVTQENISDEQKLQAYVDRYNRQNPDKSITVKDLPDNSGFWGGAREVGFGMLNAVRDQFPEDVARIWQGDDVKLEDDSWSQQWIDEQEKDKGSRVLSKQVILGDTLNESLYHGPASIATSATVGTAGAAVGASAGSVVPVLGTTAGAMFGAAGATGPAFYRLAKNQFLHEMLDLSKQNNVEITEHQWDEIKQDIDDEATEIGLWEAGPEAVSQFFTAGLIEGGAGKIFSKIPGLSKVSEAISKKAIARIPTKLAAEVAEEEVTEYTTFQGQEEVRKEVGLRETDPTLQEFVETQAGPVAVGAVLQLGVHKAGSKLLSSKPSEVAPEKKKIVSGGEAVDLLADNQVLSGKEGRAVPEQGVEKPVAEETEKLAAFEGPSALSPQELSAPVPSAGLDLPNNVEPEQGQVVLLPEAEPAQQEAVDPDLEWDSLMGEAWDTAMLELEAEGSKAASSVAQPSMSPAESIVSNLDTVESVPDDIDAKPLNHPDALPPNRQSEPEQGIFETAFQELEQESEFVGSSNPNITQHPVQQLEPETVVQKAGLGLKKTSNSKGEFWVVTGETYANKKALKEAGAKWNRGEKGWAFYQEESPLETIAEQLDRLPASLGDTVLEPVDRSTYDENSRRTTRQTRLFEEQLRKEYGLDFPDGSVFAVRKNTDLLSSQDRSAEEGMAGADGDASVGRTSRGVGRDLRGSDLRQEVGDKRVQKAARNGRGSEKQGLNESRMLDRIAGLFGKKIVYVASDLPIIPGEAHADLKQNIVFMRPDANHPHLFLLGHEVIHLLKKEAPALYGKLYDLAQLQSVEGRWDAHYKWRDRKEREAGRENGLTRAQADEELIADFSGEQFMDPDFWEELAAEEPTLFRKVAKKVKQLIDKVLSVFSRSGKNTRFFHDIELVRKGLVSVLAEYSRQQDGKASSRQNAKPSNRHDGDIHFSKTSSIRNPTSVRSVRGAVQQLQARAENALPLKVVGIFEELPEHIRKAFKAQGGGFCEACNDPKTGKVWMVAENIASRKRAVELWLHEQGAHHGLRGLMGDSSYGALLRKVHVSAKNLAGYKDVVTDYDLDLSKSLDRDIASHEYLAKIAEKVRLDEALTSREKTIWRKVVDAVLNWLTKIRVRLPGSLTRVEMNRIVSDAVFWTVQGDGAADLKSGEAAPSYSRQNPARKSAMAKIGQPISKSRTAVSERIGRIREFMTTEFQQGMFDRFASLKKLDQDAGISDIEESAYVAARMSTSHADQIAAVIEHGSPVWREGAMDVEGEGLAKVFEPIAHELDRYTAWLVGLRARKLMSEGRENLFTEEEIDELCALNQGRETKYEDVRQKYIQFKTKVLDFAEEAGVVSGSGRLVWEHDEYIPFYRINDETADVKAPRGKKGIASQYSGIKRLQGGTSNLGDPFENIIRNFSHLIDASVKNKAMDLAMNNAERMGVAVPADFKWQGVKLKGGSLRSALTKVLGKDGVAPLSAAQRDSLQTVFQMVKPDAKDVVHVLRDGKPVYYHVGDALLLRSLTSVHLQSWNNMGMKAARFFKRVLTTGITSTPDFMLRNIVRDTVHAWGVDRTGTFKPIVGSVKGAIKSMRKDEDTVKMMAAGAAFHGGYSFGHDPGAGKLLVEKLVKKHGVDESTILDSPKKLAKFMKYGWDRWQDLGSSFENATRAKLYEGVSEKGGTHLEAAYEAKDIMDYSMGGDWPAIRLLCETVPFFGARMVGLHRLGRGAYENPQGFMAKGAMVALASVLLYLNNRDREEFKELEHWDRDNYYHFFIGDKHLRMPKPFEIGAIFGTLPERLTEYTLDGKDGDLLADRLQFMLTQTFSVGTPQIITPVLEQWADKSFFTGRSIVPMRLKRLRPEAQRDHRTSETAAVLGEKTGTSPKRIEHLVNGYFGTLGVYVLSMSDIVTRKMVDAPEMPSRRWDEYPLLKSFYKDKPARHSRYLTELYEMIHEADELYATVMAYSKTGSPDKAKELMQDQDNRKLLGKRKGLNQLRRAIGQIETAIRQVHRSRKLTPDEKRARIDALLERRNKSVRRVIGRRYVFL